MQQTALATKFPELIKKAFFALKVGSTNQWDARMLSKELFHEAQNLKGNNLYQRFVVEGLASAISGDIQDAAKRLERAITHCPDAHSAVYLVRMYEQVGQPEEARDAIEKYWIPLSRNPDTCRDIWTSLGRMGYLSSAYRLSQEVRKMGMEMAPFDAEGYENLAKEVGLREVDLVDAIKYIRSCFKSRSLLVDVHRLMLFSTPEGQDRLLYEFMCPLRPAECVDFECEIIQGLIQRDFVAVSSGAVVFSLVPQASVPSPVAVKLEVDRVAP